MQANAHRREQDFADALQLYTLAVERRIRGELETSEDRRLVAYYAGYLEEMYRRAVDPRASTPEKAEMPGCQP